MGRRGRPSTNGHKRPLELLRSALLIAEYNRVRASGLTDRAAKIAALAAVRNVLPGVRMSMATVDRALRDFQPRGHENVFLFKPSADGPALSIVRPDKDGNFSFQPIANGAGLALSLGPRPRYRKHQRGHPLRFGRKRT